MAEDINKPAGEPELKPLPGDKIVVMIIYLDKKTQRVEIEGLIGNKPLCLNALAEAIKTVTNFEPSKIIVPQRPGLMGMVKKIIGRG